MRHSKAGSRAGLSDDLEVLADRAVQRGAVSRANDLRAVAEHLRTKEDRTVVGPAGPGERRARSTRVTLRRTVRGIRTMTGRPAMSMVNRLRKLLRLG
jgi:hypothetical protein